MLDPLAEIEIIPDFSMIGLLYGLLGFMALVIGVGWISKILAASRFAPRKQPPLESNSSRLNRKRDLHSKRKSR